MKFDSAICSLCVLPIYTHFCIAERNICLDCAMWQTPDLNDVGGEEGIGWTIPFYRDFARVSLLVCESDDIYTFFEYAPSEQAEYLDAEFLWRHTGNG